ncbi:MAG TPA: hypothetical protein VK155_19815 [Bacteroidales bacterium]|nr:hypothetical protein [Bacteroidales bacterium]
MSALKINTLALEPGYLHHPGQNRVTLRSLRPYWHRDENENPVNGLRSLKNIY